MRGAGIATLVLVLACEDVQYGVAPDAAGLVDAAAAGDAAAVADAAGLADAAVADAGAHGRVGIHGMLLFGSGTQLFLSHLPAFSEPHTAQVIVAGHFPAPPAALTTDFSASIHSFVPGQFSLDELRTGALTEIRGAVYRGNFEQGGTMLASDVLFRVSRIIFNTELSAAAASDQRYIVFGGYAAHQIGAAPDFDHLIRADVVPPLSATDAERGVVMSRASATPGDPGARLRAAAAFSTPSGSMHVLTLVIELSCLVGPGFSAVCP